MFINEVIKGGGGLRDNYDEILTDWAAFVGVGGRLEKGHTTVYSEVILEDSVEREYEYNDD